MQKKSFLELGQYYLTFWRNLANIGMNLLNFDWNYAIFGVIYADKKVCNVVSVARKN
jgi:hypothetical protein